jgi:hypothetical protein
LYVARKRGEYPMKWEDSYYDPIRVVLTTTIGAYSTKAEE